MQSVVSVRRLLISRDDICSKQFGHLFIRSTSGPTVEIEYRSAMQSDRERCAATRVDIQRQTDSINQIGYRFSDRWRRQNRSSQQDWPNTGRRSIGIQRFKTHRYRQLHVLGQNRLRQ